MARIRDRILQLRARPDGGLDVLFRRSAAFYYVPAQSLELQRLLEAASADGRELELHADADGALHLGAGDPDSL